MLFLKIAQHKLFNIKQIIFLLLDPRTQRKSLKRALSWKTRNSGSSLFDKDKDKGWWCNKYMPFVVVSGQYRISPYNIIAW